MRVSVIGTGYVGLVTGVCLAHIGHQVLGVDNNTQKIALLKQGLSPIFEPGLGELLQDNLKAGRLEFTTDVALGVAHGEILFIAVGTPALSGGASDTSYVEAVARGIGEHLTPGYRVVVNKSTVPIGSGDWVRMLILEGCRTRGSSQSVDFDVVSNPEFLREGVAIQDTFCPDRIVLGSSSERALRWMQTLYAPIVHHQVPGWAPPGAPESVPVVVTDLNSAEMIKYAANAFLATKISFINEIANICDRVGADVQQIARGIGLDSRIGQKFLRAGIGWGGSCFPKDVAALIHTADDYGYNAQLLKAVVSVNQRQRWVVVEKLQQTLKILNGKTIGILGLTFKPDTDDLRDAPALLLADHLNRLGARVKAYDPVISQGRTQAEPSGVVIEANPEDLCKGCDALVLTTEWEQFRHLDYSALASLMDNPVLIDGRNFLDPKTLEAAGFRYLGIGYHSL